MAPPRTAGMPPPEALPFQTRDRKAELLAHHCRRRRFQLLVRFFEALRRGQASTRGQLPSGSQLLLMPPERRDGQTTLAKHGKAVAAERTWSPGEFFRGDTAYGCCS